MKISNWSIQNKLTAIGILITFIIGLSGLIIGLYNIFHTQQIQISLNQDLNQIKGKLAEYDTIIAKNTTFNEITVPCPNGTGPQMSFHDDGVTIRCI